MKTITNKTNNWSKLLQAATLSVFAVAPFSVSTVAQAADGTLYAQRDRDRDRNNDRRDTDRREYRTLEGVVVRDAASNDNQFVIRTTTNQLITVRLDSSQPRRLDEGDTVRVTGFFRDRDSNDRRDNNVFHASNVTIISNNRDRGRDRNNDNNRREYRTLDGVVVNEANNDRNFVLRTSNNQVINVRLDSDAPRRLNRGDRVRVYGFFRDRDSNDRRDNNVFHASNVTIISNNNNNNNNRGNRTLDGIVTDDRVGNSNRFALRVNNQIINVQADDDDVRRVGQGDRVRVYGEFRGNSNEFRATNVTIIRDAGGNDNNNNNNNNRSIVGTVSRIDRGQRQVIVFSQNRLFTVRSRDALSTNIDRGDTVRVTGNFDDLNVRNARVELIGNANNNNNNSNITLVATVLDTDNRNNRMRVRATNGRTYVVQTRNADSYRNGQRLRISGRLVNGVVVATSINRF